MGTTQQSCGPPIGAASSTELNHSIRKQGLAVLQRRAGDEQATLGVEVEQRLQRGTSGGWCRPGALPGMMLQLWIGHHAACGAALAIPLPANFIMPAGPS